MSLSQKDVLTCIEKYILELHGFPHSLVLFNLVLYSIWWALKLERFSILSTLNRFYFVAAGIFISCSSAQAEVSIILYIFQLVCPFANLISWEFVSEARAGISARLSARAEIRHVIKPLVYKSAWNDICGCGHANTLNLRISAPTPPRISARFE